jgi:hypothetical protein
MSTDYTNGWDAMVAVYSKNVNRGIQLAYNANILPHHVQASFTMKIFGFDIPATVDLYPGAWIVSGGSGKLIQISIPFGANSTMTAGGTTYDIANASVDVILLLSQIQSPIVPASGTNYTLQIDFESADAIYSVEIRNAPAGLPADTLDVLMLNALKQAFAGHTYDVATVNLAGLRGDYDYLIPTLFEYAVDTNSSDPDDTVLAVQMLTVNTKPGNQDVIAGTIPTGGTPACDGAVLISNELFVKHLILPGVASAMSVDASTLQATLSGGAWSVSNKADITLPVSHDPVVTSLSASQNNNNQLALNIVGHCVPTPGLTINFTISAVYELVVSTVNGVQTINLVQQGDPNIDHSVSVATWLIITTAAIALFVGGLMGPLGVFVVAAVEALVLYLISKIANDKAGSVLSSSLPVKVSSGVNWAYLDIFTIQQALMPLPLQLGGTIPLLEAPATGAVSEAFSASPTRQTVNA